jgi:chorismate-pyruvate lyase
VRTSFLPVEYILDVKCCSLTRILLACDGTLTRILAAAFRERVVARVCEQRVMQDDSSISRPRIQFAQGQLNRSVVLCGERTGRQFVYAESELNLYALPIEFQSAIIENKSTIGTLLECHLPFARKGDWSIEEILCDHLRDRFVYAPDLIRRSYAVHSDEQFLMTISEFIPRNFTELPS